MSWSTRIEHASDGLRLRFGAPLSTLDMNRETAAHLARLLAHEAAGPGAPFWSSRRVRLGRVDAGSSAGPASLRPLSMQSTARRVAEHLVRQENRQNSVAESVLPNPSHALCCDCAHCLNGGNDA